MKIRTQLIASVVLFCVALLIIAASVVMTNQQVDHINRQLSLVKNIEMGASELGYLSNDYLLYNESQQLDRWNIKFAHFSDDVSSLSVDAPEQQVLVDNIKDSQERLKSVFDDVVSTLQDKSQAPDDTSDKAYLQVSWSRLAVQTRGMMFDASRLSQMLEDQKNDVRQTGNLVIMSLLGAFGALILLNYLLVFGRGIKSIDSLQAGTKIIGSGNLDHTIKIRKGDEIGELADAFNQMTARLKTVTASRNDLEREIIERQQAQEALRDSRARLQAVFDSMTDAVFVSDTQGNFIDFNEAFATYHKFRNKEECYKTLAEYPDYIDVLFADGTLAPLDMWAVPRALRGETVINAEYVLRRKDTGETWWGSYSFGPIRDNDGNIVGSVVVGRDITESKQIEESIRRQAEMIDLSPDAIMVSNVDGTITFWAHGAEALYGFSSVEATGEKTNELLKTVFPGPFEDILRQLRESGMWAGELIHTARDGRQVTVQSRWLAKRDQQGGIAEILVSNVDITERKQAELAKDQILAQLKEKTSELQDLNDVLEIKNEEMAAQSQELESANEELRTNIEELQQVTGSLHEAQDYLESLISYANAPIIVWDPGFAITRFNRAFERLSGYTAVEVIGNNLSILFPPESREESLDKIKRTLEGEQWESVEIPILHKYGSVRIALWNSANIYDASHNLRATIAQGQDITARKEAEKDLAEAKAQAELYLDLMGHDISNMHQILMMQLELAADQLRIEGKLHGEDRELIESSLRTLDKAARLINNVRKLQKHQSGEFRLEPVDLSEILADVLKDYSNLPGKDVIIKYCPDGKTLVLANPLLKEVFGNIVDNAVKHSGGPLVLSVNFSSVSRNGGSFYRVAIEDNGCGIPDDKKEEVFSRFKRGQTKARGTGLGLYIVKTLVEGFGGYVEVQNRVLDDYTQGTRFLVYLPAMGEKDARVR